MVNIIFDQRLQRSPLFVILLLGTYVISTVHFRAHCVGNCGPLRQQWINCAFAPNDIMEVSIEHANSCYSLSAIAKLNILCRPTQQRRLIELK